ncbi:hypothetical protein B0B52_14420 [Polaromonas sp. A23]|nr:hypothetical protein B0B52_14420 [Polaromonas sp. A23]
MRLFLLRRLGNQRAYKSRGKDLTLIRGQILHHLRFPTKTLERPMHFAPFDDLLWHFDRTVKAGLLGFKTKLNTHECSKGALERPYFVS